MSKSKKVCSLIIIDSSGSMQDKIDDVKGGLKQVLNDIKNTKGIHNHLMVCSFSDDFKVLLNTVDLKNVDQSFVDSYRASGSTALFDAIIKGMSLVPKGYDGVFVSIFTDGQENASRRFRYDDVKRELCCRKELGWEVLFVGTTEDSIAQARSWGISNTLAVTNDGFGVNSAMGINGNKGRMSETYTAYTASLGKDEGTGGNLSATYQVVYNPASGESTSTTYDPKIDHEQCVRARVYKNGKEVSNKSKDNDIE